MANEVVKDSELKVDVEEEKYEKNKDKSIEIKGIEKNEVKKFDNVRYNSCNHNFKEIPKCKHDIIKSELSTEEYNNALYSVDYSKFVKYIQEEYKEKCKNKKNDKNIIFPIPMEVFNVKKYDKNDKPWVWDLQYNEKDCHGSTWPPLFQ
eukprot:203121_1